jgi:SnoaL-like domain
MTRRGQIAVAVLAIAAGGLWWWWRGGSTAEREVRALFVNFATEFNSGATDGLGMIARAARIGESFTPDVVIELGQGSPPIHGREILMGMASRLQPRTAAFVLDLDDVNVNVKDADRADVTFTALIRRRSVASGEESIDAREFEAEVVRVDRRWQVSRVVAVDTLR